MAGRTQQARDVVIIGAGAAGLATAIWAARLIPSCRILDLEGAARIGAKILVSGGGRCNITNREVSADDYRGSTRGAIGRVLARFTVEQTIDWFREMGVELHEEEFGKLFPISNTARVVVEGLIEAARRSGVEIQTGRRIVEITRDNDGFFLQTAHQTWQTRAVVLACGGRSLPDSGSDGWGYEAVQGLGHTVVPLCPALVPLVLDGDFHQQLSGISRMVELIVSVSNGKPQHFRGAMLWTHFGASGPVVLDASGVWERARMNHQPVQMHLNFWPGCTQQQIEAEIYEVGRAHPRMQINKALTLVNQRLGLAPFPQRFINSSFRALGLSKATLAHWSREERRRLISALTYWFLPVRKSRGYHYAEVTSGGVPLSEVNIKTMESRCCPGLFLAGEILDVDGRIGGFNFQWAWSSGYVAAHGLHEKFKRN